MKVRKVRNDVEIHYSVYYHLVNMAISCGSSFKTSHYSFFYTYHFKQLAERNLTFSHDCQVLMLSVNDSIFQALHNNVCILNPAIFS